MKLRSAKHSDRIFAKLGQIIHVIVRPAIQVGFNSLTFIWKKKIIYILVMQLLFLNSLTLFQ